MSFHGVPTGYILTDRLFQQAETLADGLECLTVFRQLHLDHHCWNLTSRRQRIDYLALI